MTKPSSEFDFASVLQPGDHVVWPQGTGEPTGLTAALVEATPDLPAYVAVLGMATTRTPKALVESGARFLCLNGAAGTRSAAAHSGNRIMPAHVSTVPGLIRSRRLPVDVVLLRVRPTEEPGMFSAGVVADFVQEMVDAARVVIAEIDDRLPLTGDDALIARDRIHHLTLADGPEPLLPDAPAGATDIEVARRVAEIVPDRATIQLGIGGLPTAVCAALAGHKHLGIHSGVIPDCAVDLLENGAVTNLHKGLDEGRMVTGGLFGDRRLFDFSDGNNAVSLRGAAYTHAAQTMARLKKFYTINSAIEIDLTGQVNSELAGGKYIGAVGGQVDFVRGGRLSEGGRSIIALASTTADGKTSKIVAGLENRPVTTARSDIDIVVTEFGSAELWGLDFPARARALVAIAHPDFRESLDRSLQAAAAHAG
ncbi:acetyl-CoA hydrolase/transferase C-terminal domain-containing protein [Oricola sp.]|uniref:acetyl-CoA hydrolase/transferase family protein n=1 Tax=Oricola sp. TaxID=1979950 RepID=UPI0025F1C3A0|nr:acetyl-CoA hydrolase/transferase C-terminal domain-containing protein [Oricola sp.]MCI5075386.1 4-hydroxybutyrate CoA-transferase [Oricola sp.]